MAETDKTNADAESSRVAEVLSSVPQPNRAERRKMAALGDAVPVAVTPVQSELSSQDAALLAEKVLAPAQAAALDNEPAAALSALVHSGSEGVADTALAIDMPAPKRQAAPRKLPAAAKTITKPVAAKPVAKTPVDENTASKPVLASVPALPTQAPSAEQPAQDAQAPATPLQLTHPLFSIKDMTMDMSTNFNGIQTAMTDAQAKAKAAFEKSSSVMGEVGEFTKGNVEAVVESSKIFAEGCQEIGSTMVAEGRTAFEAMTGDIKELAAAKSPTDFLKIQSDMIRKSFDSAVAYSSKNSETFLKLMSDAAAPLSGRMSLAVEKVRQNTVTATAAA
jgi:hypothetical protein